MTNDSDLTPSPLEGGSAAAAGRSRGAAFEDIARRLTPIVELFERVHAELDDGKSWEDIDDGLRHENGRWSYENWYAYMSQRLINGAKEIAIVHRYIAPRLQPAAAGEAPISAEAVNTEKLQAVIQSLAGALEPFVRKFNDRRDAYIRRYPRNPELGADNFDKMPDAWKMDELIFKMGDFRRARSALSSLREGGQ